MPVPNEVALQRTYYSQTASQYDEMHLDDKDEHFFALRFLSASIDFFAIKSILDVGSGTGRAIRFLKDTHPHIKTVGVDPVKELREMGYKKGLNKTELLDGDATNLQFGDNEFDFVCEFGVLHHVKTPEKVIDEMLRVSKKGIFVSDINNFGHGSFIQRSVKQIINTFGLWKLTDYIKTKGKGYIITEGDGLSYSYSVFNNYKQIRKNYPRIHLINTKNGQINLYRTASHIALLAVRD